MKVGVFSGTFDPIHDGHIGLAAQALETGLDRILFMPEAQPRRKNNVSSIADREAMITLAIADNLQFETYVPADHYTHTLQETLQLLRDTFGRGNEYVLIMGGDVFEHVPEWPDVASHIHNLHFIVGLREEDDGETATAIKQQLDLDVILIQSKLPAVSSASIRTSIQHRNNNVPLAESVLQYIHERRLYQNAP